MPDNNTPPQNIPPNQQPPAGPDPGQQQPPAGPDPGQQQPPAGPDPGQQQPPAGPDPGQQQPPAGPDPGQQQPPAGADPGQQQPPAGTDPGQQQQPPAGPDPGQNQQKPTGTDPDEIWGTTEQSDEVDKAFIELEDIQKKEKEQEYLTEIKEPFKGGNAAPAPVKLNYMALKLTGSSVAQAQLMTGSPVDIYMEADATATWDHLVQNKVIDPNKLSFETFQEMHSQMLEEYKNIRKSQMFSYSSLPVITRNIHGEEQVQNLANVVLAKDSRFVNIQDPLKKQRIMTDSEFARTREYFYDHNGQKQDINLMRALFALGKNDYPVFDNNGNVQNFMLALDYDSEGLPVMRAVGATQVDPNLIQSTMGPDPMYRGALSQFAVSAWNELMNITMGTAGGIETMIGNTMEFFGQPDSGKKLIEEGLRVQYNSMGLQYTDSEYLKHAELFGDDASLAWASLLGSTLTQTALVAAGGLMMAPIRVGIMETVGLNSFTKFAVNEIGKLPNYWLSAYAGTSMAMEARKMGMTSNEEQLAMFMSGFIAAIASETIISKALGGTQTLEMGLGYFDNLLDRASARGLARTMMREGWIKNKDGMITHLNKPIVNFFKKIVPTKTGKRAVQSLADLNERFAYTKIGQIIGMGREEAIEEVTEEILNNSVKYMHDIIYYNSRGEDGSVRVEGRGLYGFKTVATKSNGMFEGMVENAIGGFIGGASFGVFAKSPARYRKFLQNFSVSQYVIEADREEMGYRQAEEFVNKAIENFAPFMEITRDDDPNSNIFGRDRMDLQDDEIKSNADFFASYMRQSFRLGFDTLQRLNYGKKAKAQDSDKKRSNLWGWFKKKADQYDEGELKERMGNDPLIMRQFMGLMMTAEQNQQRMDKMVAEQGNDVKNTKEYQELEREQTEAKAVIEKYMNGDYYGHFILNNMIDRMRDDKKKGAAKITTEWENAVKDENYYNNIQHQLQRVRTFTEYTRLRYDQEEELRQQLLDERKREQDYQDWWTNRNWLNNQVKDVVRKYEQHGNIRTLQDDMIGFLDDLKNFNDRREQQGLDKINPHEDVISEVKQRLMEIETDFLDKLGQQHGLTDLDEIYKKATNGELGLKQPDVDALKNLEIFYTSNDYPTEKTDDQNRNYYDRFFASQEAGEKSNQHWSQFSSGALIMKDSDIDEVVDKFAEQHWLIYNKTLAQENESTSLDATHVGVFMNTLDDIITEEQPIPDGLIELAEKVYEEQLDKFYMLQALKTAAMWIEADSKSDKKRKTLMMAALGSNWFPQDGRKELRLDDLDEMLNGAGIIIARLQNQIDTLKNNLNIRRRELEHYKKQSFRIRSFVMKMAMSELGSQWDDPQTEEELLKYEVMFHNAWNTPSGREKLTKPGSEFMKLFAENDEFPHAEHPPGNNVENNDVNDPANHLGISTKEFTLENFLNGNADEAGWTLPFRRLFAIQYLQGIAQSDPQVVYDLLQKMHDGLLSEGEKLPGGVTYEQITSIRSIIGALSNQWSADAKDDFFSYFLRAKDVDLTQLELEEDMKVFGLFSLAPEHIRAKVDLDKIEKEGKTNGVLDIGIEEANRVIELWRKEDPNGYAEAEKKVDMAKVIGQNPFLDLSELNDFTIHRNSSFIDNAVFIQGNQGSGKTTRTLEQTLYILGHQRGGADRMGKAHPEKVDAALDEIIVVSASNELNETLEQSLQNVNEKLTREGMKPLKYKMMTQEEYMDQMNSNPVAYSGKMVIMDEANLLTPERQAAIMRNNAMHAREQLDKPVYLMLGDLFQGNSNMVKKQQQIWADIMDPISQRVLPTMNITQIFRSGLQQVMAQMERNMRTLSKKGTQGIPPMIKGKYFIGKDENGNILRRGLNPQTNRSDVIDEVRKRLSEGSFDDIAIVVSSVQEAREVLAMIQQVAVGQEDWNAPEAKVIYSFDTEKMPDGQMRHIQGLAKSEVYFLADPNKIGEVGYAADVKAYVSMLNTSLGRVKDNYDAQTGQGKAGYWSGYVVYTDDVNEPSQQVNDIGQVASSTLKPKYADELEKDFRAYIDELAGKGFKVNSNKQHQEGQSPPPPPPPPTDMAPASHYKPPYRPAGRAQQMAGPKTSGALNAPSKNTRKLNNYRTRLKHARRTAYGLTKQNNDTYKQVVKARNDDNTTKDEAQNILDKANKVLDTAEQKRVDLPDFDTENINDELNRIEREMLDGEYKNATPQKKAALREEINELRKMAADYRNAKNNFNSSYNSLKEAVNALAKKHELPSRQENQNAKAAQKQYNEDTNFIQHWTGQIDGYNTKMGKLQEQLVDPTKNVTDLLEKEDVSKAEASQALDEADEVLDEVDKFLNELPTQHIEHMKGKLEKAKERLKNNEYNATDEQANKLRELIRRLENAIDKKDSMQNALDKHAEALKDKMRKLRSKLGIDPMLNANVNQNKSNTDDTSDDSAIKDKEPGEEQPTKQDKESDEQAKKEKPTTENPVKSAGDTQQPNKTGMKDHYVATKIILPNGKSVSVRRGDKLMFNVDGSKALAEVISYQYDNDQKVWTAYVRMLDTGVQRTLPLDRVDAKHLSEKVMNNKLDATNDTDLIVYHDLIRVNTNFVYVQAGQTIEKGELHRQLRARKMAAEVIKDYVKGNIPIRIERKQGGLMDISNGQMAVENETIYNIAIADENIREQLRGILQRRFQMSEDEANAILDNFGSLPALSGIQSDKAAQLTQNTPVSDVHVRNDLFKQMQKGASQIDLDNVQAHIDVNSGMLVGSLRYKNDGPEMKLNDWLSEQGQKLGIDFEKASVRIVQVTHTNYGADTSRGAAPQVSTIMYINPSGYPISDADIASKRFPAFEISAGRLGDEMYQSGAGRTIATTYVNRLSEHQHFQEFYSYNRRHITRLYTEGKLTAEQLKTMGLVVMEDSINHGEWDEASKSYVSVLPVGTKINADAEGKLRYNYKGNKNSGYGIFLSHFHTKFATNKLGVLSNLRFATLFKEKNELHGAFATVGKNVASVSELQLGTDWLADVSMFAINEQMNIQVPQAYVRTDIGKQIWTKLNPNNGKLQDDSERSNVLADNQGSNPDQNAEPGNEDTFGDDMNDGLDDWLNDLDDGGLASDDLTALDRDGELATESEIKQEMGRIIGQTFAAKRISLKDSVSVDGRLVGGALRRTGIELAKMQRGDGTYASRRTAFHESFHVVLEVGMTKEQYEQINHAGAKQFGLQYDGGIASNQLRERMADEAAEYFLKKADRRKPKGLLQRLFQAIYDAITSLFKSEWERHLDRMYAGAYAQQTEKLDEQTSLPIRTLDEGQRSPEGIASELKYFPTGIEKGIFSQDNDIIYSAKYLVMEKLMAQPYFSPTMPSASGRGRSFTQALKNVRFEILLQGINILVHAKKASINDGVNINGKKFKFADLLKDPSIVWKEIGALKVKGTFMDEQGNVTNVKSISQLQPWEVNALSNHNFGPRMFFLTYKLVQGLNRGVVESLIQGAFGKVPLKSVIEGTLTDEQAGMMGIFVQDGIDSRSSSQISVSQRMSDLLRSIFIHTPLMRVVYQGGQIVYRSSYNRFNYDVGQSILDEAFIEASKMKEVDVDAFGQPRQRSMHSRVESYLRGKIESEKKAALQANESGRLYDSRYLEHMVAIYERFFNPNTLSFAAFAEGNIKNFQEYKQRHAQMRQMGLARKLNSKIDEQSFEAWRQDMEVRSRQIMNALESMNRGMQRARIMKLNVGGRYNSLRTNKSEFASEELFNMMRSIHSLHFDSPGQVSAEHMTLWLEEKMPQGMDQFMKENPIKVDLTSDNPGLYHLDEKSGRKVQLASFTVDKDGAVTSMKINREFFTERKKVVRDGLFVMGLEKMFYAANQLSKDHKTQGWELFVNLMVRHALTAKLWTGNPFDTNSIYHRSLRAIEGNSNARQVNVKNFFGSRTGEENEQLTNDSNFELEEQATFSFTSWMNELDQVAQMNAKIKGKLSSTYVYDVQGKRHSIQVRNSGVLRVVPDGKSVYFEQRLQAMKEVATVYDRQGNGHFDIKRVPIEYREYFTHDGELLLPTRYSKARIVGWYWMDGTRNNIIGRKTSDMSYGELMFTYASSWREFIHSNGMYGTEKGTIPVHMFSDGDRPQRYAFVWNFNDAAQVDQPGAVNFGLFSLKATKDARGRIKYSYQLSTDNVFDQMKAEAQFRRQKQLESLRRFIGGIMQAAFTGGVDINLTANQYQALKSLDKEQRKQALLDMAKADGDTAILAQAALLLEDGNFEQAHREVKKLLYDDAGNARQLISAEALRFTEAFSNRDYVVSGEGYITNTGVETRLSSGEYFSGKRTGEILALNDAIEKAINEAAQQGKNIDEVTVVYAEQEMSIKEAKNAMVVHFTNHLLRDAYFRLSPKRRRALAKALGIDEQDLWHSLKEDATTKAQQLEEQAENVEFNLAETSFNYRSIENPVKVGRNVFASVEAADIHENLMRYEKQSAGIDKQLARQIGELRKEVRGGHGAKNYADWIASIRNRSRLLQRELRQKMAPDAFKEFQKKNKKQRYELLSKLAGKMLDEGLSEQLEQIDGQLNIIHAEGKTDRTSNYFASILAEVYKERSKQSQKTGAKPHEQKQSYSERLAQMREQNKNRSAHPLFAAFMLSHYFGNQSLAYMVKGVPGVYADMQSENKYTRVATSDYNMPADLDHRTSMAIRASRRVFVQDNNLGIVLPKLQRDSQGNVFRFNNERQDGYSLENPIFRHLISEAYGGTMGVYPPKGIAKTVNFTTNQITKNASDVLGGDLYQMSEQYQQLLAIMLDPDGMRYLGEDNLYDFFMGELNGSGDFDAAIRATAQRYRDGIDTSGAGNHKYRIIGNVHFGSTQKVPSKRKRIKSLDELQSGVGGLLATDKNSALKLLSLRQQGTLDALDTISEEYPLESSGVSNVLSKDLDSDELKLPTQLLSWLMSNDANSKQAAEVVLKMAQAADEQVKQLLADKLGFSEQETQMFMGNKPMDKAIDLSGKVAKALAKYAANIPTQSHQQGFIGYLMGSEKVSADVFNKAVNLDYAISNELRKGAVKLELKGYRTLIAPAPKLNLVRSQGHLMTPQEHRLHEHYTGGFDSSAQPISELKPWHPKISEAALEAHIQQRRRKGERVLSTTAVQTVMENHLSEEVFNRLSGMRGTGPQNSVLVSDENGNVEVWVNIGGFAAPLKTTLMDQLDDAGINERAERSRSWRSLKKLAENGNEDVNFASINEAFIGTDEYHHNLLKASADFAAENELMENQPAELIGGSPDVSKYMAEGLSHHELFGLYLPKKDSPRAVLLKRYTKSSIEEQASIDRELSTDKYSRGAFVYANLEGVGVDKLRDMLLAVLMEELVMDGEGRPALAPDSPNQYLGRVLDAMVGRRPMPAGFAGGLHNSWQRMKGNPKQFLELVADFAAHNIKALEAATQVLGVRTPATGAHSGHPGKIVRFISGSANTIYINPASAGVSGEDFDGDGRGIYKREYAHKYAKEMVDEQATTLRNEIFNYIREYYLNTKNNPAIYEPINLKPVTKIEGGSQQRKLTRGSIASEALMTEQSNSGKQTVGSSALYAKSYNYYVQTMQQTGMKPWVVNSGLYDKLVKLDMNPDVVVRIQSLIATDINLGTDNSKLMKLGVFGQNADNTDMFISMLGSYEALREELIKNYEDQISYYNTIVKGSGDRAALQQINMLRSRIAQMQHRDTAVAAFNTVVEFFSTPEMQMVLEYTGENNVSYGKNTLFEAAAMVLEQANIPRDEQELQSIIDNWELQLAEQREEFLQRYGVSIEGGLPAFTIKEIGDQARMDQQSYLRSAKALHNYRIKKGKPDKALARTIAMYAYVGERFKDSSLIANLNQKLPATTYERYYWKQKMQQTTGLSIQAIDQVVRFLDAGRTLSELYIDENGQISDTPTSNAYQLQSKEGYRIRHAKRNELLKWTMDRKRQRELFGNVIDTAGMKITSDWSYQDNYLEFDTLVLFEGNPALRSFYRAARLHQNMVSVSRVKETDMFLNLMHMYAVNSGNDTHYEKSFNYVASEVDRYMVRRFINDKFIADRPHLTNYQIHKTGEGRVSVDLRTQWGMYQFLRSFPDSFMERARALQSENPQLYGENKVINSLSTERTTDNMGKRLVSIGDAALEEVSKQADFKVLPQDIQDELIIYLMLSSGLRYTRSSLLEALPVEVFEQFSQYMQKEVLPKALSGDAHLAGEMLNYMKVTAANGRHISWKQDAPWHMQNVAMNIMENFNDPLAPPIRLNTVKAVNIDGDTVRPAHSRLFKTWDGHSKPLVKINSSAEQRYAQRMGINEEVEPDSLIMYLLPDSNAKIHLEQLGRISEGKKPTKKKLKLKMPTTAMEKLYRNGAIISFEDGVVAKVEAVKDGVLKYSIDGQKTKERLGSNHGIRVDKRRLDSRDGVDVLKERAASQRRVKKIVERLKRAFPGLKVQYISQAQSQQMGITNAKSFILNGTVYINLDRASEGTAIHEILGHTVANYLATHFPKEYQALVDSIRNSFPELAAQVDRVYADQSQRTRDDEIITHWLERYWNTLDEKSRPKTLRKSIWQTIIDALKDLFDRLGDALGYPAYAETFFDRLDRYIRANDITVLDGLAEFVLELANTDFNSTGDIDMTALLSDQYEGLKEESDLYQSPSERVLFSRPDKVNGKTLRDVFEDITTKVDVKQASIAFRGAAILDRFKNLKPDQNGDYIYYSNITGERYTLSSNEVNNKEAGKKVAEKIAKEEYEVQRSTADRAIDFLNALKHQSIFEAATQTIRKGYAKRSGNAKDVMWLQKEMEVLVTTMGYDVSRDKAFKATDAELAKYGFKIDPEVLGDFEPVVIVHNADDDAKRSFSIYYVSPHGLTHSNFNVDVQNLARTYLYNNDISEQDMELYNTEADIAKLHIWLAMMSARRNSSAPLRINRMASMSLKFNSSSFKERYGFEVDITTVDELHKAATLLMRHPNFTGIAEGTLKDLIEDESLWDRKQYQQSILSQLQLLAEMKGRSIKNNRALKTAWNRVAEMSADGQTGDYIRNNKEYSRRIKFLLQYYKARIHSGNEEAYLRDPNVILLNRALLEMQSGMDLGPLTFDNRNRIMREIDSPGWWHEPYLQHWHNQMLKAQRQADYKTQSVVEKTNALVEKLMKMKGITQADLISRDVSRELFGNMFRYEEMQSEDGSTKARMNTYNLHVDVNDAATQQAIKNGELTLEEVELARQISDMIEEHFILGIIEIFRENGTNMGQKDAKKFLYENLGYQYGQMPVLSKSFGEVITDTVRKEGRRQGLKEAAKQIIEAAKNSTMTEFGLFDTIDPAQEVSEDNNGNVMLAQFMRKDMQAGRLKRLGIKRVVVMRSDGTAEVKQFIDEEGEKKNNDATMNLQSVINYTAALTYRTKAFNEHFKPAHNALMELLKSWAILENKAKISENIRYMLATIKKRVVEGKTDEMGEITIPMPGGKKMKIHIDGTLDLARKIFSHAVLGLRPSQLVKNTTVNIEKAVSTALSGFHKDGKRNVFTMQQFKDAVGVYAKNPEFVHALNKMYLVANKSEHDLIGGRWNVETLKSILQDDTLHIATSWSDYQMRLVVMVAQMMADGTFDAHIQNEPGGPVHYDVTKDKRFYDENGKLKPGADKIIDRIKEQLIDMDVEFNGKKQEADQPLMMAYDHINSKRLRGIADHFIAGIYTPEQLPAGVSNVFVRQLLTLRQSILPKMLRAVRNMDKAKPLPMMQQYEVTKEGELQLQGPEQKALVSALGRMLGKSWEKRGNLNKAWKEMSEEEKQELKMWSFDLLLMLADMGAAAALIALAAMLLRMDGDDDDDKLTDKQLLTIHDEDPPTLVLYKGFVMFLAKVFSRAQNDMMTDVNPVQYGWDVLTNPLPTFDYMTKTKELAVALIDLTDDEYFEQVMDKALKVVPGGQAYKDVDFLGKTVIHAYKQTVGQ